MMKKVKTNTGKEDGWRRPGKIVGVFSNHVAVHCGLNGSENEYSINSSKMYSK